MTCPVCGGSNTCIASVGECDVTYRRRKCNECGHVFYTIEHDIDSPAEYLRIARENASKRKEKRNAKNRKD